jgi:hypothetical protein
MCCWLLSFLFSILILPVISSENKAVTNTTLKKKFSVIPLKFEDSLPYFEVDNIINDYQEEINDLNLDLLNCQNNSASLQNSLTACDNNLASSQKNNNQIQLLTTQLNDNVKIKNSLQIELNACNSNVKRLEQLKVNSDLLVGEIYQVIFDLGNLVGSNAPRDVKSVNEQDYTAILLGITNYLYNNININSVTVIKNAIKNNRQNLNRGTFCNSPPTGTGISCY